MLPSSPQVKTVYSEANGVISALESLSVAELARSLFIDSTTLDVGIARNVAAEVISAGAQMVDAPVSGGTYYCCTLPPHPCLTLSK
jgi:3-hydroxyisobutyrate dehydrogenase